MNTELKKQIGRRIWQARRAKGLDQDELGHLIGKSEQTVRNWEAGVTSPKGKTSLPTLAGALGVSAQWIMGVPDNKEDK